MIGIEPTTLYTTLMILLAMATCIWIMLSQWPQLRTAAWLLGGSNACLGLSLWVNAQGNHLPMPVVYWLSSALGLGAFALMQAAIPCIELRPPSWRAALLISLACLLGMAVMHEPAQAAWIKAVMLYGTMAVLGGLTAASIYVQLRRSGLSRLYGMALCAPLLLLAAVMLARPLETAWTGHASSLIEPNAFNAAWLLGTFVLMLLLNATMIGLMLTHLLQTAQRLAEHDPLTDSLNRRALQALMARAHASFRRGQPYALIMLDLDHFKRLNDQLGHAAGDAALKAVAALLRQSGRRRLDASGRFGGEEFCIVLPDTELVPATLVAERLRMRVDALPFAWQGRTWALSASLGVSVARPGDTSADDVLARADAALYRAKRSGRNRVQAQA